MLNQDECVREPELYRHERSDERKDKHELDLARTRSIIDAMTQGFVKVFEEIIEKK